jgi:hypothetical protein
VGFGDSENAAALAGMPGFVLVDAVQFEGELWQLIEIWTTGRGAGRVGVGALSKGRRTVKVRDLPGGGRWPAGRDRVVQADLALPGNGVRRQDVDGAARRRRRPAGAHGRAQREASRRVGRNRSVAEVVRGARRRLDHGHCHRGRRRHAAGGGPRPDRGRGLARVGQGQVPEGESEAAHPLRHRVHGPRPGPAPRRQSPAPRRRPCTSGSRPGRWTGCGR